MVCCLQSLTSTSPRPHISNCREAEGWDVKECVSPCTHRVTRCHCPFWPEGLWPSVIYAHTGGSLSFFPEYSSYWRMAAHCHNVTELPCVCLKCDWQRQDGIDPLKLLPGFQRHTPNHLPWVSAVLCMSLIDLLIRKKHLISNSEQGSCVCTFP